MRDDNGGKRRVDLIVAMTSVFSFPRRLECWLGTSRLIFVITSIQIRYMSEKEREREKRAA